MSPTLFLRVKGAAMVPLGLVMLVAPAWFMGLFGEATSGDAALVFIQLMGLVFVGLGLPMATTPAGYNARSSESLALLIADLVAMGLLIQATLAGAMGGLGYVFAAIYAVSALGFFYCWAQARKATA